MRNLTTQGLCLVAIFATNAVLVSAAQAADLFHAEKVPTYYTANSTMSNHELKISHSSPITIKCSLVNLKGESKGNTTNDMTLHPEYRGGCKWNNLTVKVVVPFSCNYTFTLPVEGTAAEFDIVGCPTTAPISMTAPGCTMAVANQSNLKSVTLANQGVGTTRDIEGTINAVGLSITMGPGCPTAGTTIKTASYVGTSTVIGYSNAAHDIHQGIWVQP